jgi:hypothetical protein
LAFRINVNPEAYYGTLPDRRFLLEGVETEITEHRYFYWPQTTTAVQERSAQAQHLAFAEGIYKAGVASRVSAPQQQPIQSALTPHGKWRTAKNFFFIGASSRNLEIT